LFSSWLFDPSGEIGIVERSTCEVESVAGAEATAAAMIVVGAGFGFGYLIMLGGEVEDGEEGLRRWWWKVGVDAL